MDSFFIPFLLFAIGTANAASLPELGTRIVGGSKASISDFPYQVALATSNGTVTCGGSIINENHVLTAAHCVKELYEGLVIAGTDDLSSVGSIHHIVQITQHEDYAGIPDKERLNDIAVLVVFPCFDFDKTIAPIELSEDSEDIYTNAGQTVTVTGYGQTSFEEPSDGKLRNTTLNIVSSRTCNKIYERARLAPILDDRFCAGDEESKKDTCTGDSGSAVVMNGRQIGITSYGKKCAEPGLPSVYTNVGYFSEWIKSKVIW